MRPDPIRTFGLALALAMTAPLGACSTPPSQSPAATAGTASTAAPSHGAMGTIKMDVSQLFPKARSAGQRQTLGYGLAADRVTHVRLRIQRPGQSASTVLTPTPVSLDTSTALNKTVECAVTAGPNQVVTVEALDASGVMLMRLRGATNVPASGVATVRVGMLEDCVARIIEKLITDGAPYLTDDTLIGSLTTFVTGAAEYAGAAPQYFEARSFTDNFSSWGDNGTVWLTAVELQAWLTNPDSREMVGSGFPAFGPAWYLSLNDLVNPSEYPATTTDTSDTPPPTYDPTLWRVALIAPINGVWNHYENLGPEFFDGGDSHPYTSGYYFRIGGMPPGKYTLLLTHPTNDTKLVFDLGGGYDGPFYFDAQRRP